MAIARIVLYHLWFNVESHLPHPYSVSLNFSTFSMLSALNHWLHTSNENISICNIAYTHFRVHLSQYLYISHRMLKSGRVIARTIQLVCGSVQSQEKRLGFLAQPAQNKEKPIWNSDCTDQMCLPTNDSEEPPEHWEVYIVCSLVFVCIF